MNARMAIIPLALLASTPANAGFFNFLEKIGPKAISNQYLEQRREFYRQVGEDAKKKQEEALKAGAMSEQDQLEVKLDQLYYRVKYPEAYKSEDIPKPK